MLSALVAWKFGYGAPALAALVLTWFLIALTFIDVDTQLLPDCMTLPLVWLGLATSAFLPTNLQASLPVDLHDSVIGAMAGYLSLWSIYHLFKLLTGKEGMGYGDFKLLAAIGAFLGWRMLLPTVLGAAAVGAVVGIVILSLKGKGRGVPIAFGPFLAASGWIMLMWGRELLERLSGPVRSACLNRPLQIGLTGGIASGKSTVGGLFAALGVPVIDTDQIARDLVAPGQPRCSSGWSRTSARSC